MMSGDLDPIPADAGPASGDAAPPGARPPWIGGWLLLPALGLVVAPFPLLFRSFIWWLYTGIPIPPVYREALWFLLLTDLLLVVFNVSVATVFFARRRHAPQFMVMFYLAYVALAAGQILVLAVHPETQGFTLRIAKQAIPGLIWAAIWIPYFGVSKRVKATFVR